MSDAPSLRESPALARWLASQHEFEVWQDGAPVAEVSSVNLDEAWRDALHYAAMYGQDGPVQIVQVQRRICTPAVTGARKDGSSPKNSEGPEMSP